MRGAALSDARFLRSGLQWVLGQCDSGCDFLQSRQDGGKNLACSTWFDAFHSKRPRDLTGRAAARRQAVALITCATRRPGGERRPYKRRAAC
jgi:hypothetical protein